MESKRVSEKEKYLEQLKIANERVQKCLAIHPNLDVADLFRIALNKFKSPDDLLATGLRRKIISGN